MSKINKNAHGFTIIEAIIIIIVVAVIGLAGWFVYHKHQETNKKATTTSSTTKAKTDSNVSASTSPTNTTKPTQDYFTISEWGVRAPYTGTDRFTYTMTDSNNLQAISKGLAASDSGCSTFGGGQIARYLGSDKSTADETSPTVAQNATQNPGLYTQVGSYYYQFRHDEAQCGSISITAQNQANADLKALVANLKSYSTN